MKTIDQTTENKLRSLISNVLKKPYTERLKQESGFRSAVIQLTDQTETTDISWANTVRKGFYNPKYVAKDNSIFY